jgi:exosortase N
MVTLLNRWLVLRQVSYKPVMFIAAVVVAGCIAFPASYLAGAHVLVGMCLLPYAMLVQGKTRFNMYYFIATLLCCAMAFTYSLKIFFFLALAFYVLLVVERYAGSINVLVLFLLVFMSPVFVQVVVMMGFPIRLLLSAWSGRLLLLAGYDIQVEGNMIILNSVGFAVDEACMGLNMLAMSMLMGVFIIAHRFRAEKVRLAFVPLSLFFLVVFMLNLVCNLLRIMVLVVFAIMPENPMHEGVGIMCLVFYVMVPLYFIAGWLTRRYGTPPQAITAKVAAPRFVIALLGSVAVLLVGLSVHMNVNRQRQPAAHTPVHFDGMQAVKIEDGITRLLDDDLLVYVKPIPEFFTGEHTPLICWKGSGYAFKSIRKEMIGQNEVYCGTLVKQGDTLFTAWWYTNGKVQTIDQLVWRTRMMKGEKSFCLVNVTTKDEAVLMAKLREVFEKRLLEIN